MQWNLIVEPRGRPGAENMAIDEALLAEADRTGKAFLRLYRWNPPCLSLGRNELAIERPEIAVVRRPTGGRAVWHEHEVTYAVAAPISMFGRLRDAYRAIHERLAAALRSLGVDAKLADGPDRADRPDRPGRRLCFASVAGGEILAQGRKLVGSAQVRRDRALLQHGSILLDGSQEVVGELSREHGAESNETTLRQVLGRPVTFEEVAEAIVCSWGAAFRPSAPPPVRPSAFLDPAWTWRR
ncbi:MAG TPA: hypothetical protein VGQ25_04905 [Gemmatimonadales bacterium]|nr:hypothetical protein [Gemmatimonadales bacterium]